ncbi:hypothetical protein E2C01_012832 [Portunus trituberculatus]|uniref:Uncharacterized protein n=1 Tax=Portunus trituberculatus TaxID=210409 RepID=A0A5B7DEN0_PORTR|nr:hypothetical protein [Portunus trituberculatus]
MQETEAANNQSSELVQDFSEPETNQEESQDIITVEKFDDFLTDPNSEELKDNSSLELKDDTSSSSFHGWTEGETDFKLNIKEIFEESREIAETNGVDSSSTPGKFTESSKDKDGFKQERRA